MAEQLDRRLVLVVALLDHVISLDGVVNDLFVLGALGSDWLRQFVGGRSRPAFLELLPELFVRLLLLVQRGQRLQTDTSRDVLAAQEPKHVPRKFLGGMFCIEGMGFVTLLGNQYCANPGVQNANQVARKFAVMRVP